MLWQVRFDAGHQQRYLPDRAAVLRYVLAVGPRAASPRFEVFAEGDPVRLADGSEGGRQFSLVEVIDLSVPGEIDRLRAELDRLISWRRPWRIDDGPVVTGYRAARRLLIGRFLLDTCSLFEH